tara:strand:+ start:4020 stop:4895 length:876 start_codon:yes stop_codon:yes gene_type:complete
MIKIKCFCDFVDNNYLTSEIIRCSELTKSKFFNKKYIFVDKNDANYTHAIIINNVMPVLNIPKENVIGLAWEPIQFLKLSNRFIEYAKKNIGAYYISEKAEEIGKPFINDKTFLTHVSCCNKPPVKSKFMSIMFSNKLYAPGHKYRHTLVKKILDTNLPIDIWGKGHIYYKTNDTRMKGKFKDIEPYKDYMFHIAIENYETKCYYSEKIINCFMYLTCPIYLGCKNIDYSFKNVIKLSGNIDSDIKLLKNIYDYKDKYRKNIDLVQVKNEVCIEKLILSSWCECQNKEDSV